MPRLSASSSFKSWTALSLCSFNFCSSTELASVAFLPVWPHRRVNSASPSICRNAVLMEDQQIIWSQNGSTIYPRKFVLGSYLSHAGLLGPNLAPVRQTIGGVAASGYTLNACKRWSAIPLLEALERYLFRKHWGATLQSTTLCSAKPLGRVFWCKPVVAHPVLAFVALLEFASSFWCSTDFHLFAFLK